MTKAIQTLIRMLGTAYSGRVWLGEAWLAVLVVLAAAPCGVAHAQARPSQPDLTFPKQASELGFFSPLEMGIWKDRKSVV